jgi:transposase
MQISSLSIPVETRHELESIVARLSTPQALAARIRMILLTADGLSAEEIGQKLNCSGRVVRKWRARFQVDPRLPALLDAKRSGRPAQISVVTRLQLVKLACDRPDPEVTAFRDVWTYQSLSDALFEESGVRISISEVGRILRFEKLRPHHVEQWLHSPDPDFVEKAEEICKVYLDEVEGPVVCVDEKPLVIRTRKYPTRVAADASVRREYEYKRHGTGSLIAAFDVGTGEVFGHVGPDRKADTLVAFMDELAEQYPKGPVTIVWDNLNTHKDGPTKRWTKFNERHGDRFRFVYTPVHASWLNQIECWFSILERRVLRHGDFDGLDPIRSRILGFIDHWNTVDGHPFRWTWRTDNLQSQTRQAA